MIKVIFFLNRADTFAAQYKTENNQIERLEMEKSLKTIFRPMLLLLFIVTFYILIHSDSFS